MRVLLHAVAVLCLSCTGSITGPNLGEQSSGPRGGEDPPDDVDQPVVTMPPASGIFIENIALNQAVQVMLVENGEVLADRNAFVVAGAPTEVMVTFGTENTFVARDVLAELTVTREGAPPYVSTLSSRVASSFTGPIRDTPFSFSVPQGVLTEDAGYSVSFLEVAEDVGHEGSVAGARFPAEGNVALGAESINGAFRVVLVPFAYNADGSGRLPPLDDVSIEEYRAFFSSMFPNTQLELSVRAPVNYNRSISASGNGWDTWLDTLTELREQDDPESNAYYYGFAAPRSSFGVYCSGGCVAGLGFVPAASEDHLRASVGISFVDDIGVYTAMHEVGHTLGRPHAPCGGPAGVDPNFPYRGASIGVWGLDRSHSKWKDPDVYSDIMGYCRQQWISDYTFNAVFNRLATVNQEVANTFAASPTRYRVGLVDAQGDVTWRRETTLKRPMVGRGKEVELLDGRGHVIEIADGQLVPYDHLPGGMLFLPANDDALSVVGAVAARVRM